MVTQVNIWTCRIHTWKWDFILEDRAQQCWWKWRCEGDDTVLYHPSSGWICLAPRQDPLHSDDDISQNMWHGLLQLMASSLSSVTVNLCPIILLPSGLLPSKPTTCGQTHPQLIPMKIGYHPWITWPQADLWHLSLWRKCGECSRRDRQYSGSKNCPNVLLFWQDQLGTKQVYYIILWNNICFITSSWLSNKP